MTDGERKTALITGASGGIGLDFARLFAKDRYDLVLVARSEGKLNEIGQRLGRDHGVETTIIAADLAKAGTPPDIAQALAAKGIEIEVLVNNAGLAFAGAFAETDLAADLATIQVNLTALTHLTKLFLPPMVARRSGRILNVASTAAFQPGPLMAVYYAAKAYVLSFSDAIAEELRDSGVTVTTLCPGPTRTGFAAAAGMEASRLFTRVKPMTSAEVARIGYAAMKRGWRVVVPGFANKLGAQSIRISPRWMVARIVRKVHEKT